jgi:hypothetical protein
MNRGFVLRDSDYQTVPLGQIPLISIIDDDAPARDRIRDLVESFAMC